jgi:hypothetical protein
MFRTLANMYRDVVSYEQDPSKIPLNIGRREPNANIDRRPSNPAYAALLDKDNRVVRLFDVLYFEMRQIRTPAVTAFVKPFAKCFNGDKAHVGSELDKIGAMWGTSPKRLFEAARRALEADISAHAADYQAELSTCESRFNTASAFAGGASALSIRVGFAHESCLKEIAELEAQLASARATARTLKELQADAAVLAAVEPVVLGKRRRSSSLP